jgi:hypothetical protein
MISIVVIGVVMGVIVGTIIFGLIEDFGRVDNLVAIRSSAIRIVIGKILD